MSSPKNETLIGAVVVTALGLFIGFSYGSRADSPSNLSTYQVSAEFGRTDGLYVGDKVRVSGIDIGKVVGQELTSDFRSLVTIELPVGLEMPLDTAAVIRSDGLMGTKFMELEPGGDMEMLAPGDSFEYTQDAVVLDELLSKIVDMAKANRAKSVPADGVKE